MIKTLFKVVFVLSILLQVQNANSQTFLGRAVTGDNTYGAMRGWNCLIKAKGTNFLGDVEARVGESTLYSAWGHGSGVTAHVSGLKKLQTNSAWHAFAGGGKFGVSFDNATIKSNGSYTATAAGVSATISGTISSYSGKVTIAAVYGEDKIKSSKTFAGYFDGRVGINGKLEAESIEVKNVAADFVFSDGYNLRPLSEVETFIDKNGHLPDVAPASETVKGIDVSEFNTTLLQKIEELTLYMIELKKENEELRALIEE